MKHRKDNLAPHSAKAIAVYDSLVYAKTGEKLGIIKGSTAYTTLSPAARAAIDAVPDCVQYLPACAAAGGSTYGRTASQAVKSQNGHIAYARALDLPNSALWLV